MSTRRVMLDPTSEQQPARRQLLPRPESLAGLTVGLLDISKPRGDVFLDKIDELLSGKGIAVKRYSKPSFTRVAPVDLKQRIAEEVDVVVEGLAD